MRKRKQDSKVRTLGRYARFRRRLDKQIAALMALACESDFQLSAPGAGTRIRHSSEAGMPWPVEAA